MQTLASTKQERTKPGSRRPASCHRVPIRRTGSKLRRRPIPRVEVAAEEEEEEQVEEDFQLPVARMMIQVNGGIDESKIFS